MKQCKACGQRVLQHIHHYCCVTCTRSPCIYTLSLHHCEPSSGPYTSHLNEQSSLPSTNTVMPRNMSYRKPVPEYIPSPPPSPLTAQEESSSEEYSTEEVPPLPTEWREAIGRALSSPTPSLDSSSEESDQLNGHHSFCTSNVIVKRPAYIRSDSACSAAALSQEERRQRQLHHIYRPPTPPLPTHQPKQRKMELSVEWLDSCSTLPNISRSDKFHSTAMRLQRSRSTGQTLVATSPVKESPAMTPFAGRNEELSSAATLTSTMKRICRQLATKLGGRMQWLRC